jgi:hypothetical protein
MRCSEASIVPLSILPGRVAGRVAQVVECLPSKCEVLSSNSSNAPPKWLHFWHFFSFFGCWGLNSRPCTYQASKCSPLSLTFWVSMWKKLHRNVFAFSHHFFPKNLCCVTNDCRLLHSSSHQRIKPLVVYLGDWTLQWGWNCETHKPWLLVSLRRKLEICSPWRQAPDADTVWEVSSTSASAVD